MTFSVFQIENNCEKVLGTIWAEGESQARQVALDVYPPELVRLVQVKAVEMRELPFRLPDA